MITPVIHLNGSSAETLKMQLKNAAGDLDQAITSLALAAPHGRDYYLLGPDALATAMEEHRDRLKRLTSVLEELNALHHDIVKQQAAQRVK
jgi:ferredoxin-NADP reductase